MSDFSSVKKPLIRVDAITVADQAAAVQWAQDLGLPLDGEAEFALQVSVDGLQLQELSSAAPGPIRVDFIEGALAHRRQFGGGSGQMIAKAIGIQAGVRPTVLDATAGLGRDAFVLACLGCQVQMIERNPIVAALLADGLRRARLDSEVLGIVQRMPLLVGDAIELMTTWTAQVPQVIHLDPMFPSRDKSALVKKEMRLFKPLVGADADAADLLAAALALASHRVVVNRARKAPAIAGTPPTYSLEGKSSRYDIYAKKSLKP